MTDPTHRPLHKTEFIAMMAMMFAIVAFSTDAMMPALPEIAAEIADGSISQAAMIITFFVMGMGLGTFVTGPMSDAFGRKPVVYGGLLVYGIGAALCWAAPSIEWMLAARVLQGLGAAGPRIVSTAVIRDSFAGRTMASILS